ncbi:hypothetical protein HK101_010510 [Irineochytrium annulatum]|nr:hypothetical protein HK101_010510 [Irineochytrium annulatum]
MEADPSDDTYLSLPGAGNPGSDGPGGSGGRRSRGGSMTDLQVPQRSGSIYSQDGTLPAPPPRSLSLAPEGPPTNPRPTSSMGSLNAGIPPRALGNSLPLGHPLASPPASRNSINISLGASILNPPQIVATGHHEYPSPNHGSMSRSERSYDGAPEYSSMVPSSSYHPAQGSYVAAPDYNAGLAGYAGHPSTPTAYSSSVIPPLDSYTQSTSYPQTNVYHEPLPPTQPSYHPAPYMQPPPAHHVYGHPPHQSADYSATFSQTPQAPYHVPPENYRTEALDAYGNPVTLAHGGEADENEAGLELYRSEAIPDGYDVTEIPSEPAPPPSSPGAGNGEPPGPRAWEDLVQGSSDDAGGEAMWSDPYTPVSANTSSNSLAPAPLPSAIRLQDEQRRYRERNIEADRAIKQKRQDEARVKKEEAEREKRERERHVRVMKEQLAHLASQRKSLAQQLVTARRDYEEADRLVGERTRKVDEIERFRIEAGFTNFTCITARSRESIAELEAELSSLTLNSRNHASRRESRFFWLRRLATIASLQTLAINKATSALAPLEASQEQLFAKAHEAAQAYHDGYGRVEAALARAHAVELATVRKRAEVDSLRKDVAGAAEGNRRATEIVVKVARDRNRRVLHRQAMFQMVQANQAIFTNLNEHIARYSRDLERDVQLSEDQLWQTKKMFVDDQTKTNAGKITECGIVWEHFDWSRIALAEYDCVEVGLGRDPHSVELNRLSFNDVLVERTTRAWFKIDMGRPIDAGDFRQVHRVLSADNRRHMGKVFHLIRGPDFDMPCAVNMAKLSTLCDLLAIQFCRLLLETKGERWDIRCLPLKVLRLPVAPATGERGKDQAPRDVPTGMMVEPFLTGSFQKFVDNFGVIPSDLHDPAARRVFPAMAHWSFVASNRRFLLADIQGISEPTADPTGPIKVTLTDPGIHTLDRGLRRQILNEMDGNYGDRGIAEFFAKHECTELCRDLGIENFRY